MTDSLNAIVLRPFLIGDESTGISFLTEQGEKYSGIARGTKRSTSKWIGSFEPLNHVVISFLGRESAVLKKITRCELSFSPFTLGSLDSNLVMVCLADLFDRVTQEGIRDPRLFRLLKVVSEAIGAQPQQSKYFLGYAEFWILQLLGLLPDIHHCGHCMTEDHDFVTFSDDRGWICSQCDPQLDQVPKGMKQFLTLLKTESPLSIPFSSIHEGLHREVTNALRTRLLHELNAPLKSYEVLFRSL